MVLESLVITQAHETWAAREKRAAGERWALMVVDQSQPQDARLRDMYQYALSAEEKERYWKNGACVLVGRTLKIAVHEISNGLRSPVLRGRIIHDGENAVV